MLLRSHRTTGTEQHFHCTMMPVIVTISLVDPRSASTFNYSHFWWYEMGRENDVSPLILVHVPCSSVVQWTERQLVPK